MSDDGCGGDPLWYKDAVIYEARVRAIYDSNGDGIGDFPGLTEKLDYFQDLGVTALWLLPFYPSPLRDDGYDISDYTDVHPECGTLADFKVFLREAHRRGLRVITELVLNHTSDQHPWFQRARRAKPGSKHREWYVWSDTPDRYKEARIIFKDFEPSNWSYDPVARAYYWHRFYAHQPDLNYDCPDVHRAIVQALDFWLSLGVDGLRLDAIPYLYEREGTGCENLPETHAFLKKLRRHVDLKYRDRMLLAEANQWPEDAAAYFGEGDACHMAFHFPIMPRLFMSIQMEDRFPLVDILEQTPAIPASAQWALFLRNHDELTLEMVTDEERDYMYRVYAYDPQARLNLGIRRRLAPLLGNNRRKMELMNALLFSMPGTPVVYYGDEIGMGDNVYLGDRNGVRTPMQWSADRNAGFSRANPQKLYAPVIIDPEYHYETVNVEAQQANQSSLLWWTKRVIALRKRYKAFGRGTFQMLHPRNSKVLAFTRQHEDERILVVANLSRFAQCAEIDLSAFRGLTPVELFGGARFPEVGERPYFLTLGPYGFYWFALERHDGEVALAERPLPLLRLAGPWARAPRAEREAIEAVLAPWLAGMPWVAGEGKVKGVRLLEAVPLPLDGEPVFLAVVEVERGAAAPETYLVPLALATGEEAERVRHERPRAVIAEVSRCLAGGAAPPGGLLCDAFSEGRVARALVEMMSRRAAVRAEAGEVLGSATRAFRALRAGGPLPEPTPARGARREGLFFFGDRLVLKLFRRFREGARPEVEVGALLSEQGFAGAPPFAGAIEYRSNGRPLAVLGLVQGFVPNEADGWRATLDELARFFERALSKRSEILTPPVPEQPPLELCEQAPPPLALEMVSAFLELARLLGRRVAELHLALAAEREDPAFAPEPFTALYQRSLYQSARNLVGQVFSRLRDKVFALPAPVAEQAARVLSLEKKLLDRFGSIRARKLAAMRIRVHGDLHLGRVVFTGKDFVIVDFEGEPERPLSEGRIKRSALRDVASLLRSLDRAVHAVLGGEGLVRGVRPEDKPALEPWARYWLAWTSSSFLKAYLGAIAPAGLLPSDRGDLAAMLDVYLLERAVGEVAHSLDFEPERLASPLAAIEALLG